MTTGTAETQESEAAAVWVPVETLHPWEGNPRRNAHAIDRVADSIRRLGWGAPLVARRANGQIIAGHTRYEAALRLGMTQVPVRFVDLDPGDAQLMALADNRLGELADWDAPQLAELLGDLPAEAALLAGWTESDLDVLQSLAAPAEGPGGNGTPQDEWTGLPEFTQGNELGVRTIKVHFRSHADVDDFKRLLGQDFGSGTKYIWHPRQEPEGTVDERYFGSDDQDSAP